MSNQQDPFKNPMEWLFRASVLLFATMVVLNLTVVYIQRILPWLAGGIAIIAAISIAVMIARWRRSRW